MSDNLLDRAKASLEGVTEGVWTVDPMRGGHCGVRGGKYQLQVVYARSDWEGFGNGSRLADAEFIAAARQLVPELIAEVERLERALEGRVWELERERDSHLETAAIMRRTRERAERLEAALQSSIHIGLHPESLCGNDCSGCVSPAEGGY